MDIVNHKGVFDHLLMLERAENAGLQKKQQQERLQELAATVEMLCARRDEIQAETSALKTLKDKIGQGLPIEENKIEEFVEHKQSLLTSRHMQLKDLQTAYHLIGFDFVESKEGKSVCVTFHTAYEGVYLETYNMELDLTRTVQISRHNIPPCIPLEKITKENLQSDFKAFLQNLSLYLNALTARKQQISLIKELVGTVEVLERNQLCSFLALVCKAPLESDEAVLCTLEYADLTRSLPTHVTINSENKALLESPQWKKNQALFMESPVHSALLTMRKMGSIS
ncbi:centromere protein O isoform X2 [Trichomycterus rosablanca]|uniref:centromere protein O isoform X2 n=1 Tax=Trichomycterus rosablanca TaxID=2290929 RepID=UPI002F3529BC